MSLAVGQKLLHYQIVDKIGAGGMGEIWRARDTRLDREVAIKVLPPGFASNEQLLARFEREARTISSLNHPNICTLFDVGHENDTHFLVMELIEGESLAERVRQGPMPVDQVVQIGRQIASALDAAHRQGIIHRDLKPANVMLTRSGAKLLDFGLAKTASAFQPAAGDLTSLPTQHKALTEEGTILGTFQYMAPEQLEGVETDARADIFALGAILYEMATGKPAFEGKGRASLIASIIERDPPPISSIVPLTPPALERVVSTCLKKDPDERWQTAHDVKLGLDWIAEGGSAAGVAAPVIVRRKTRERLAWAVAALLLLATLAVGWVALARGRLLREQPRIVASIEPPAGSRFETFGVNIGALSLSPDGRWLTFVANSSEGKRMLHVRPLNSGAAQPLAGTEGAMFPFWSPDSQQIGFFAAGKLKKIDRGGGAAITVCDASDGRGGTWNRDGVIVFAPETQAALFKVSAGGGPTTEITTLDKSRNETTHRHPMFLPDGKRFLYIRASHGLPNNDENNAIWVSSLDGGEPVRVIQSGSNAMFADGHLFYVRDNFLMAQPFDPRKLELTGDAFAVGESVGFLANYFRSAFAVSETGIVAFQQGYALETRLAWMDRAGKQLALFGEVGQYSMIRLSPDEKKLAVTLSDPASGTNDLWVYDVAREVKSRLTFDEMTDEEPVWSPDGSRIAFKSNRTGVGDIYLRAASGGASAELLYGSDEIDTPEDWSSDGKYLAIDRGAGKNDLWIVPLEGDREPFPLVQGEFDEGYARFSPDTKWIAYGSNESGQYEMYVTRFPSGEGKWQLSTQGADWLIGWRRDGGEIYYQDLEGRIVGVKVTLGDELVADLPEILFPTQTNRTWAATGSGDRFIIGVPETPTTNLPITLVINWHGE